MSKSEFSEHLSQITVELPNFGAGPNQTEQRNFKHLPSTPVSGVPQNDHYPQDRWIYYLG